MFVRNRTPLSPRLARGMISEDVFAASITIDVVYRIVAGELVITEDDERSPTDPPEVGYRPQWRGTSVTAFATVPCPARAPFSQRVEFTVAARRGAARAMTTRAVTLHVQGDRVWTRGGAGWTATPPARFDRIPLTWARAYGGTLKLAPHLTRAGLPHPGGRVPYVLNPHGRGLCVEGVGPIEGTALPNVEHPLARVTSPADQPSPYGLAPCPELSALRIPREPTNGGQFDRAGALHRMIHHAPGWLIFDEPLRARTTLSFGGTHTSEPLEVALPPSPARVEAVRGKQRDPLEPQARSVHLDADRQTLRVAWGYDTRYTARRAPRWLHVSEAT